MSTSHLSPLRNKKRRERLEWLGDAVVEEAIVRLVAHEAMASLEREEVGGEGFGVPANLRPLSGRLDFALRLAVSNANLGAVYEAELAGLIGFLGLEENRLGLPAGKRCRCSSVGGSALISTSPTDAKRNKRRPDLVESAIGEAFAASLELDVGQGAASSGPQQFVGSHRAALVDRLLSSALCTELLLSSLESRRGGEHEPEGAAAFANRFGALDTDDDDDDDVEAGVVDSTSESSGLSGRNNSSSNEAAAGLSAVGAGDEWVRTDYAAAAAEESDATRLRRSGGSHREEFIGGERDAVLRLYGSALIRFRVSVFLFCSGAVVSGDGGEEGPSELTMRRQKVLCADNLEAVAVHLQSVGHCEKTPVALAAPTARHWMRAAVGHAALCEGGTLAFSTRVAALLLSRSGERGAAPLVGGNVPSSPAAPRTKGGREGGAGEGGERGGRKRPNGKDRGGATAVAAEAQFGRDPWPAKNFQRAREKAARLFCPRSNKTIGSSKFFAASCAWDGDRWRASGGPTAGEICDGDTSSNYNCDFNRNRHCLVSTLCGGRKRKRETEGKASKAGGVFGIPPHYAGLVGGLPRGCRYLLARLGHQGYVKVLEELLDRFLCATSAPDIQQETPEATQCSATTRLNPVLPASMTACELGSATVKDVAGAAISTITAVARDASNEIHAQQPLDDAPDPWRALQDGKPHPSLSGLVEPLELAQTGPTRMVLPIPNPFYRRVLHALCKVHGLCSRGGETGRASKETVGNEETIRHRTVEVTRSRSGAAEGAAATRALIPVETLLSSG